MFISVICTVLFLYGMVIGQYGAALISLAFALFMTWADTRIDKSQTDTSTEDKDPD